MYKRLVSEEVFPSIAERTGDGYLGYDLARREHAEEIEYVTITRFESWDAVEAFAGTDYETAHVPPAVRELLTRFEDQAAHYERRESTTV